MGTEDIDYLISGLTIALSLLLIIIAARAYRKSRIKILRPLLLIFIISFLTSILISLSLLGIVAFPYYDTILIFMFFSMLIIYLYLLTGLSN